jgi:hypothetical protein
MGIINDARPRMSDLPAEAQFWAAGASADKRSAEGSQDAARHAEWTASTAALIEEATKKGLMTEEVRKLLGENPAAALDYLARGLGGVGAMAIGAGGEAIGMGKALWQAGGQAVRGEFGKAGGIISDAYNSSKMDLHNNMAGAVEFSQIKDPAERRAAILKAAEAARLQQNGVTVSPFDAAGGELVRRR